jgi:RimJ/RimL family protein N-acetyltransferase
MSDGSLTASVSLRDVVVGDLDVLFAQQLDPEVNRIAVTNARSRDSFDAHWATVLADPTRIAKVIVQDGVVLGRISCFRCDGLDSLGYWVAREHWGKGVITRALALLLAEIPHRVLHARVATTNVASIRALQRQGFVVTGQEHAPATDRFPACEEAILVLSR